MDFIVDQYFPIVEALEDELEGLEDEIFRDNVSRDTTTRIYQLKRELLAVKRAVSPLVEVCNRLTRFDVDLIPEDTRPYFRDVYDHVIRINDMIDNTRELLTTALEANLSLITISQNEDTKRLAGWAAIITTPTLIASIYGMNFERHARAELALRLPGRALPDGGRLVTGLYIGFKRSGWLHEPSAGPSRPALLQAAHRRARAARRIIGAPPVRRVPLMSTSRLVRSLVVAAGICVLAGAGPGGRVRGQQPQPPPPETPTFRTDASFVLTDVFVTADGKPVTDLTQADFEVKEDGVVQAIRSFEAILHTPQPVGMPRRNPSTVAESNAMIADPRRRVFVVFLDTYHVDRGDSMVVRKALQDFLKTALGPDDLVAYMTPHMSGRDISFSTSTEPLIRYFDDNPVWGVADESPGTETDEIERNLQTCFIGNDAAWLAAALAPPRAEGDRVAAAGWCRTSTACANRARR